MRFKHSGRFGSPRTTQGGNLPLKIVTAWSQDNPVLCGVHKVLEMPAFTALLVGRMTSKQMCG